MSLRIKSLLIFSIVIVLLFGIIVILEKSIVEKQFDDMELNKMLQQAEQFSADLQNELKPVVATVGDWAAWNELYDFMEGKKPSFIRDNLNERTLIDLRLDFFSLWGEGNKLLFLETVPLPLARSSLEPSMLLESLRKKIMSPSLDIDKPFSGLVMIGNQMALISGHPILRSDRTGVPMGIAVGGRILDHEAIRKLEGFSRYRIQFTPMLQGDAPTISVPQVRILNAQNIAVIVPIFGIHGNLIANAELISNRPLHLQAEKTTRIFLIALASSAGILLFVVWYLLDANVIHPLQRLAAKLQESAVKGQLPFELGFSGEDELSNLAQSIEDLARALAHTEAKYRAIVEDQIDLIFRYCPDGRITFVNEALCRYLNKSHDEVLGSNAYDFIEVEDADKVSNALKQLTIHSPVVTLDHRVCRSKGDVAWVRRTDRAIFSETGHLLEFQCVASDVTQAHLAREWLKASELRYRRLFETATDGILIIAQLSHIITDANPEVCRILNCNRSLLIDHAIESVTPFKSPKTLRVLSKLLDGSSPVRHGEIILFIDGETRYLEVIASIYEAQGEAIAQLNFRDISERKRISDEFRQLSGHLLRVQEEERRRIARDLHDSTAQNFSALQMAVTQLESLNGENGNTKVHNLLVEIRKLTDMSLREIRTISYLLHPPLLDEVGLLFALRWYIDGFMTRTEKIVHLDIPDTLERLKPEIETTIFRVVQECLGNIHRHSGSRKAWIHLALEDNALYLEIRDEGKGVAPPPSGPYLPDSPVLGVGIAGMRERLHQLNGSLSIDSSSCGTTVRAVLPLEFHENSDH